MIPPVVPPPFRPKALPTGVHLPHALDHATAFSCAYAGDMLDADAPEWKASA